MSDKSDRRMLEQLVKVGQRFRATPIVDDDFLTIKCEFDLLLDECRRWLERPLTAVDEQPAPVTSEGDVWLQVVSDMRQRRQHGIDKYGVPVQPFNGRRSMVDLYQELLDATVYCKNCLIEEERRLACK